MPRPISLRSGAIEFVKLNAKREWRAGRLTVDYARIDETEPVPTRRPWYRRL